MAHAAYHSRTGDSIDPAKKEEHTLTKLVISCGVTQHYLQRRQSWVCFVHISEVLLGGDHRCIFLKTLYQLIPIDHLVPPMRTRSTNRFMTDRSNAAIWTCALSWKCEFS